MKLRRKMSIEQKDEVNKIDLMLKKISINYFKNNTSINNVNWGTVLIQIYDKIIEGKINLNILNSDIYKIEKIEGDSNILFKGGNCELLDKMDGNILPDITKVKINLFYPSVIKKLIESNIMTKNNKFNKAFLCIFYYIKCHGRQKIESFEIFNKDFFRSWIYMTFSKINISPTNMYNNIGITHYSRKIFEEIYNNLNWVYVDTDTIFCYNSLDEIKNEIGKYDLDFVSDEIQYFYPKARKRYLMFDKYDNLKSVGMKRFDSTDVESFIKTNIRNKKIENLLK